MCKYIQLNNFQKVPFVYTYTRIRAKIIHDTAMYKYVKFFDKIVNRRDFLKLINRGSTYVTIEISWKQIFTSFVLWKRCI